MNLGISLPVQVPPGVEGEGAEQCGDADEATDGEGEQVGVHESSRSAVSLGRWLPAGGSTRRTTVPGSMTSLAGPAMT